MEYQSYIVRDPNICAGEPVVQGTRVTIRTVLASLGEGASIEEILRDFPTLSEQAVRAVIAFAAVSAEEDLPVPSMLTPMKIKLDENILARLVVVLNGLGHDVDTVANEGLAGQGARSV